MKQLNERAPVIGALGLLWYECGQDFALFCYRIGCGAVTVFRLRALELSASGSLREPGFSEPLAEPILRTSTRNNDACSNLSFTSCAPCTSPMDSRN